MADHRTLLRRRARRRGDGLTVQKKTWIPVDARLRIAGVADDVEVELPGVRSALRASGLDVARPFAPPLVVTLSERPGVPTRGTDRIGRVDGCTFTGAVPCLGGAAHAAFLVEPGGSLLGH